MGRNIITNSGLVDFRFEVAPVFFQPTFEDVDHGQKVVVLCHHQVDVIE